MSVLSEVQKLTTDNIIELYVLDTRPIGGTDIFRFTKSTPTSGTIKWDGNDFVAIDMDASGFQWDGSGAFPKPRIKVSNVNGLFSEAIRELGDIVGASFTLIQTFEQFTDTGSNPDTEQTFPLEIYSVEQKVNHNLLFVEWTLSTILDQAGRMLPGRLVLRDVCPFSYRLYDAATDTFDYSKATCPYTGTDYFDENGNTTTKANDTPSKRLGSCCKKRFGVHGVLPFGGFPGVQRKRVV